MKNRLGQGGFTIVELLIASTVFSMVLIICTSGVLQVGKTYYKGITSSQVQEAARSITEEITRTIQFNGGNVGLITNPDSEDPSAPSYLCIGDKRFAFVINRQLTLENSPEEDQSRHVLVVDKCSNGAQPLNNSDGSLLPDSEELMAPNMRLTKFEVAPMGNDLYKVTIRVVHGHRDVLKDTDPSKVGPDLPGECLPSMVGGQFCSVSELTTTVQKRVK